MIQDVLISEEKWLEVLLWYRGAPHQKSAALMLYHHIRQSDPCLLSPNSDWFARFTARDKLVHSFTHPDGE